MENPIGSKERNAYYLLISLCILVYLVGWQIPLMEIDAAQYANISREMLLNKSYLMLFDRGKDYLDKPPMLFWLSSLSMSVFGIGDMAYRLPSFLFSLLSIFSVYRLASLFYRARIALLSALVLAACQAMFLINHDVRTDTMLMGWVIAAIWQLAEWFKTGKWRNLVFASVCIGGGMLTKGPIALIVPILSFSPHFLLQRSFRQFFRWEYLLVIIIIGVLLIPMSIGLYRQFDLHPEKIMYGQRGISGLRFYYWTQSFGRITGESTWHENDSFFFLFENMLWGFLPWIIFFVTGLVYRCVQLVRNKFIISKNEEWISPGGFLIAYCALASSRAQLPHYIYIVFPLAAIVTGKFLHDLLYTDIFKRMLKPLYILHLIIYSLLLGALFLLITLPFPPVDWIATSSAVVSLLLVFILLRKKILPLPPLVQIPVFTILIINIFIDAVFYPRLLKYQMSIGVTAVIKEKKLNKDRFFIDMPDDEYTLHFYNNHFFKHLASADSLRTADCLLVSKAGYDSLDKSKYTVIYEGEGFHVSQLSLSFLNPATRKQETKPYFILKRN